MANKPIDTRTRTESGSQIVSDGSDNYRRPLPANNSTSCSQPGQAARRSGCATVNVVGATPHRFAMHRRGRNVVGATLPRKREVPPHRFAMHCRGRMS